MESVLDKSVFDFSFLGKSVFCISLFNCIGSVSYTHLRLGCFAYSAEENTVAARMENQIEQEVKERRAELVKMCIRDRRQ